MPAAGNTRRLKTQWDSLSAAIQLSFRAIALHNATLRRDDTSAEFDASATLHHGHFNGDTAFTLRANLHNADIALVPGCAGYNYPISGKTDLFVASRRHLGRIRTAKDKIHFSNASAYGETIRQFDSDIPHRPTERLLSKTCISSMTIPWSPEAPLTMLLPVTSVSTSAGNNFDLAHIRQIHSDRVSLEGRADFVLKASGTPAAPLINGGCPCPQPALDHEPAGDLDLQAVTQGRRASSDRQFQFSAGALEISGNVQLRDGIPPIFRFRWTNSISTLSGTPISAADSLGIPPSPVLWTCAVHCSSPGNGSPGNLSRSSSKWTK